MSEVYFCFASQPKKYLQYFFILETIIYVHMPTTVNNFSDIFFWKFLLPRLEPVH